MKEALLYLVGTLHGRVKDALTHPGGYLGILFCCEDEQRLRNMGDFIFIFPKVTQQDRLEHNVGSPCRIDMAHLKVIGKK